MHSRKKNAPLICYILQIHTRLDIWPKPLYSLHSPFQESALGPYVLASHGVLYAAGCCVCAAPRSDF